MSRTTFSTLLCLALLFSPAVAACTTASPDAEAEPPASVQDVPGSDVKKVIFTADAAAAVGIETGPVSSASAAGTLKIPYAAILYYVDGSTWTYTVPEENTFLRVPVTVASISGQVATLTAGPAAGTPVVVVGAPEVLGAELEISGEQ
jgi:hypothetical protein